MQMRLIGQNNDHPGNPAVRITLFLKNFNIEHRAEKPANVFFISKKNV